MFASRMRACKGAFNLANKPMEQEIASDLTRLTVMQFHELDRTLRLKLTAIVGATVIDHLGNVVAVGAIPKIRGGSTSGERTAAAKQFALVGLGIKISQDGGIEGYRKDSKNSKVEKLAFKVM